jgi:transketolase
VRATFTQTLVELAETDRRVVLLTGDLGFSVLEPFAERFPDRFFNVGVAEQNMVGIASGLAEAGFRPYVYSIVTFATLRAYEFIRNGPVLQGLPVRIVGVGGGLEYGHNGPSHFGLEDIALMRVQPRLTVVAPADAPQARSAIVALHELPGPAYLRLGKDEQRRVEGLDGAFELGRANVIGDGEDVAIVTTGSVANEAVAAAARLADLGVRSTVAVVASIAPAPVRDLLALLERVPLAVTHEAHYVVGGLGSLVSEIVAESRLECRVVRCGVDDVLERTGSEQYLYAVHGIDANGVMSATLAAIDPALSVELRPPLVG